MTISKMSKEQNIWYTIGMLFSGIIFYNIGWIFNSLLGFMFGCLGLFSMLID